MEIILNAGLGIGVLMLLLLLFKRNKNQSDYLFLGWILVVLGQICSYEFSIYQSEIHGLWAILLFSLPLLGAPLLFLYIISLTGKRVTWKTTLLHLGAYFIYVIIFITFQQKENLDLRLIHGYINLFENSPQWMEYYAIPLAISGLVYCIWDLILLKNHSQAIVNLFSFDEKINLKWLHYVVYSYLVLFILASFLVFGATQFQLFPIKNAFALIGICLSVILIAFGFYGFRQTTIFSNFDTQEIFNLYADKNYSEKASYSKSGLTPEKIKSLANQLTEHMEITKPFLDENLSLTRLAEQSEISQSHLSQIINQHFKMNFYDFVNYYRVEEAKLQLSSSEFEHLTLLGIAFDCGFQSKSSFNRYFKKFCETTPSEFKKNTTNKTQPKG